MRSNCTWTNGHILDRERERHETKESRPKTARQLRRAARPPKPRRSDKPASHGF